MVTLTVYVLWDMKEKIVEMVNIIYLYLHFIVSLSLILNSHHDYTPV